MSTSADATAPVRTVMVWPLATVHDDDTLRTAARCLTEEEVGALLVVRREDRLIGLVSERDLVHAVAEPEHVPGGRRRPDAVGTAVPFPESQVGSARRPLERRR